MPSNEIIGTIKRVRRYATCLALAEGLALGSAAAAAAGVIFVFSDRLLSLGLPPAASIAALSLILLAALLMRLHVRRWTLLQAALAIDARYGLKERVTSAYLMRAEDSEFSRLIHADAARHAVRVRPREVARFQLSRSWILLIPFALLAGAWFLPNLDAFGIRARGLRKAVEKRAIAEQAKRIEREAQRLDEQINRPTATELTSLTQEMQRLQRDLVAQKKTARQAAMDVAELGEKFKQVQDKMREQAQQPKVTRPRPQTSRYTDRMEKALKAGDLTGAAKEMEQIKQNIQSGNLTPEQQQAAGEELKNLGGAIEGSNAMAKAMEGAGDALKQGNTAKAAEQLTQASQQAKSLLDAANELAVMESSMAVLRSAGQQLANADSSRAGNSACQSSKSSSGQQGGQKEGQKGDKQSSQGGQQSSQQGGQQG
ncbi:MAG: hypothetical protein NTX50_21025, partial [Candidatus Sumerlaeota bacterium]|nr:hypothetical protein [Candidatus Sumerlaeota bacterium]